MLESMEKARQEKMEIELQKLMNEKNKREQDELRKRDIIKQRKLVNSNIGILVDNIYTQDSNQKLNISQTIQTPNLHN